MYSKEQAKETRVQFWNDFKKYSKSKGRKMITWVLKGTQIREAQLKFDASLNGAAVMLQIDHKSDKRRLQIYERFLKYKPVINQTCGDELIWDSHFFMEGHKEVSLIYFKMDDVNIYEKGDWPKVFDFFVTKMTLLEEAFLDVKDVVKLMDE